MNLSSGFLSGNAVMEAILGMLTVLSSISFSGSGVFTQSFSEENGYVLLASQNLGEKLP